MAMHEMNAKQAGSSTPGEKKRGALFVLGLGLPLLLLLVAVAVLSGANPGAASTCATAAGAAVNTMLLVAGLLGFVVAPTVQVAISGGPRAKMASILTGCVTLALYGLLWVSQNPCVTQLFGR